jgi:hypothetical protein
MSLRTVGPIWNCGVWLAIRTNRGVPVTVADNAVDRPLVDVVIDAINADNDLSDEAKYRRKQHTADVTAAFDTPD